MRNGSLRYAEAAEGAGGRVVGENGVGAIAHMRHAIGTGGVTGTRPATVGPQEA